MISRNMKYNLIALRNAIGFVLGLAILLGFLVGALTWIQSVFGIGVAAIIYGSFAALFLGFIVFAEQRSRFPYESK